MTFPYSGEAPDIALLTRGGLEAPTSFVSPASGLLSYRRLDHLGYGISSSPDLGYGYLVDVLCAGSSSPEAPVYAPYFLLETYDGQPGVPVARASEPGSPFLARTPRASAPGLPGGRLFGGPQAIYVVLP